MNQYDLFEELCNIPGIAGHEKNVATSLFKHYQPLCDEIIRDGLGSIYALKKSKHPQAFKVMVSAHMDEVGFIVTNILDNGMLKIHPIGGWNPNTLLSNEVAIYPNDDAHNPIYGVIGSLPPHLLKDKANPIPIISDMLVDIGATSKDEVLSYQIIPGTMVVVCGDYKRLKNGDRIMAKAIDDRYGCVMGIELLHALKDVELPFDLYIGANVQEEIGTRGAGCATNVVNPDLAIVLDASPANDMNNDPQAFGFLGQGGLIRIIDSNMMPNQNFIKYATSIYEKLNLKYQYYMSLGGTDAGAIHKSLNGIPTLTACVCARYIHTNHTILDMNDYNSVRAMLVELLTTLDHEQLTAIYNF